MAPDRSARVLWEAGTRLCTFEALSLFFLLYSVCQKKKPLLGQSIFPVSWIKPQSLISLTGRSAVLCLVTQSYPTPRDPMDCNPPGFSVLGDSSGKNTGVGCLALLQGIFPTHGSNPGLLHCRRILYQLSYSISSSGL